MTIRDITYLKEKFEKFDKPTEGDFSDWLDTMFAGLPSKLVVQLKGDIAVDTNDPQNALKFQIDASTVADFSSFIFQVDSSVSQTNWEFWDGTGFLALPLTGLVPAYQNSTFGLVTYTYDNAGYKGNEIYLRYRSGFDFIWSDYVSDKVVLY
jgi:hypothetical protein